MANLKKPKFKSNEFLIEHIKSIMAFYHPQCIDNDVGGFLKDMLEINENSELRRDYNACVEAVKILND